MLIKETRPKRRNYTIALISTDVNSYYSPTGSAWDAQYFVNMNTIMSQEEQARPYFVHFTFLSQASNAIGNPTNRPPVQVFIDFQNNSYPHMFSSSQYKPNGFLKFIPDLSQMPAQDFYLEAKTNDNEEVYINSVLGVNTIGLKFMTIDGNIYAPDAPFILYCHLVPADF